MPTDDLARRVERDATPTPAGAKLLGVYEELLA